ncbi:MAG: helical backbone metal receptor [Marmoricola sp.]
MPLDDLGEPVPVTGTARRVVSLVPSLTEALATALPEALVGATDWCTHPTDLSVVRVRGTKNPDLARIRELHPDLVVANQEENRRLDVDRLRASGIPVWVTRIETLDEAFTSLGRLFHEGLSWPLPAWLDEAAELFRAPVAGPGASVVVPVWRDPWMAVGPRTFTSDLLARVGLTNVVPDGPSRYPSLGPAELRDLAPDLVLLPDEPYVFTAADGPDAFPGQEHRLVSGRLLTWYGPSLVEAHAVLHALRTGAVEEEASSQNLLGCPSIFSRMSY